MGASKIAKSTKILVLKILRSYSIYLNIMVGYVQRAVYVLQFFISSFLRNLSMHAYMHLSFNSIAHMYFRC